MEGLDDARWVADYKILGVEVRGDTAHAAAALTTVARQVSDWSDPVNPFYIATLRIAADTGHWLMVRSAETGNRWKVCGGARERLARERFTVFMLGRDIRWQPPGASADKARAMIDSIRRARGLPIVR